MVIPYEDASIALYEREKKVFTTENLELVFEENAPKTPTVFHGFPPELPVNAIVVDDLPSSPDSTGGATGFQIGTSFSIDIDCIAKHSDREVARASAYRYADAVFGSVLADGLLDRSVDSAVPRVSDLGSMVDENKKYVYQFRVSVTCKVNAVCPQIFKEII